LVLRWVRGEGREGRRTEEEERRRGRRKEEGHVGVLRAY
jgi:hypothetical protein